MAQEVQGVVHIASLFDESVSTCGATSGVLRVFWDTTPCEKRCQACRKELLAIADNLQKDGGRVMAQESRVPHEIWFCHLGHQRETFDLAIRPHDRPADDGRGALTCVAMHDPSGRRGLWFRTYRDGGETIVRLYAGREGDDASVKLRGLDPHTALQLLDVLSTARWGYELGHESDDYGDWSAVQSWFAPNEGGYCGRAVERCGATDDWAELYEMGAR